MKTFIVFAAIAWCLIAVFIAQTHSVRVCTIRCNTTSTRNVCASFGNVCRRFSNACNFRMYNCANSVSYVNTTLSRCSGMTVGSGGLCRSSTYGLGTTSSILGSLGNSGSSYTVTPIIIRV